MYSFIDDRPLKLQPIAEQMLPIITCKKMIFLMWIFAYLSERNRYLYPFSDCKRKAPTTSKSFHLSFTIV